MKINVFLFIFIFERSMVSIYAPILEDMIEKHYLYHSRLGDTGYYGRRGLFSMPPPV